MHREGEYTVYLIRLLFCKTAFKSNVTNHNSQH